MATQKKATRATPKKDNPLTVSAKKKGGVTLMSRTELVKKAVASHTAKAKPTVSSKHTSPAPSLIGRKKAVPTHTPAVGHEKRLVPPHRAVSKPVVKTAAAGAKRETAKPAPKGGAKFSKKDLDLFRKELFSLHEHLTGQIGKMRQNALKRDDEVNTEEDGSDAFDRLFTLERAGSEQETINQVASALRAIHNGRYGVCEACGCLIEKARLQALPFVKNCVACQSEEERHHHRGSSVSRRMIP